VTIVAGKLDYTPNADFNGTDTISYSLTDNGTTNGANDFKTTAGTVSVTVTAVNDAPVAADDHGSVINGLPAIIPVLTNDLKAANVASTAADEASQTLTPSIDTGPAHGAVVVNANGTITYTPNGTYAGTDSFTYHVTDNGTTNGVADPLASNVATVTISSPPSFSGAHYSGGGLLTLDGSLLQSSLDAGHTGLDIKASLDASQLTFTLGTGANDTLTLGATDIASAVVLNDGSLEISLTNQAASTLEGNPHFGMNGGSIADSLAISGSFITLTGGNATAAALPVLGVQNEAGMPHAYYGNWYNGFASDTYDDTLGTVGVGSIDFIANPGSVLEINGASAAQVTYASGILSDGDVWNNFHSGQSLALNGAALNNTDVIFTDGSKLLVNVAGTSTTLSGGRMDDQLIAGDNGDRLLGNAGNDLLIGGAGSDALYGGSGNDVLYGRDGNDYLVGGSGNNTYLFSESKIGHDVIAGFQTGGTDRIEFANDKTGYTSVQGGNPATPGLADWVYDLTHAGTTDGAHAYASGNDSLIVFNNGQASIRVLGVTLAQLDNVNDFSNVTGGFAY
jgi:hypothetical protein